MEISSLNYYFDYYTTYTHTYYTEYKPLVTYTMYSDYKPIQYWYSYSDYKPMYYKLTYSTYTSPALYTTVLYAKTADTVLSELSSGQYVTLHGWRIEELDCDEDAYGYFYFYDAGPQWAITSNKIWLLYPNLSLQANNGNTYYTYYNRVVTTGGNTYYYPTKTTFINSRRLYLPISFYNQRYTIERGRGDYDYYPVYYLNEPALAYVYMYAAPNYVKFLRITNTRPLRDTIDVYVTFWYFGQTVTYYNVYHQPVPTYGYTVYHQPITNYYYTVYHQPSTLYYYNIYNVLTYSYYNALHYNSTTGYKYSYLYQ